MWVTVLAFAIDPAVDRPDGDRGFMEKLVGRRSAWAIGEHLIWNPETRRLDLITRPRGGWERLTAVIAERVPRLGDASHARRRGIDGALAYAVYDGFLALGLTACVAMLLLGRTEWLTRLASGALELGGRVDLLP